MNDLIEDDNLAWAKRILTEKLPYCGCGNPEAVFELTRDVLATIQTRWDAQPPLTMPIRLGHYDPAPADAEMARLSELLPTDATYWFVLYALGDADLEEHGGTAPGWLTEDGKRLLAILTPLDLGEFSDHLYSFVTCPDCGHSNEKHRSGQHARGCYCGCASMASQTAY